MTANHPRYVDVAVVGAGVAGLSVALELAHHGARVAVLESRNRVGGRLTSHLTSAGPLDLGATWFWPGEHRVAALVERLGLATHHSHLGGDAMYHAPEGARRIDGNPIDVPSSRFSDGAASLAEALAARLEHAAPGALRLGTPVHHIDRTDAGIVVHHLGERTAADDVVLALPPALAVHRIGFTPPLPPALEQLAAATPVWMGAIAKVVAHYPTPFWRDAGLAGAAISHLGPMREIHDMSGPGGDPAALFGFVPLLDHGPVPTRAAVIDQLITLFGREAATPLDVVIAPWRDDPDTSPPGVGAHQRYDTYGHRLYQGGSWGGHLHWSSTETATEAPGHIEGALAAAERTVTSIGANITPTSSARNEEHTT